MKKFGLFVLLTVLLCVFAASAMADDGVQLWEDGPYFATSPFQDPSLLSSEPLRLVKAEKNAATNEAATKDMDGNTYPTEHGTWRTAGSDGLGIDPDWHIPTRQDMEELIANTTLTYDTTTGEFCFTSNTDSSRRLSLPATGCWKYNGGDSCEEIPAGEKDGYYATTGQFLYLRPNGATPPSYDFLDQELYAGEVILVSYPAPHTHGTGTDTITFTKPVETFDDLRNLFRNGGSGYLAADITATGSLTVAKDVTLCVNDKVLNLDKKGNITVNSGVTFDLYDCGTNGKITGGSAENGGTVYCKGTFNMNGGTISGNTASNDGGAVYVDEAASFNMINGTITGNSATKYGGGVYTSDGGIILEGGTISNNSALYGGGVVNNGGTFVMKNGTISGNSATEGGGVLALYNASCMKGGTISGNSASRTGGGVYISSMASFEMTAGQICNNDAPSAGGILCRSTAVMKLVAANDKTIEITGNKATKYEGGIANWSTMHLSGNVIVKNNTCEASGRPVNLATSNAISIDGALTGSEICITHADKDNDFNNTGILTSGFTTANPGAKLGDFFTYDGPDDFAMILNSSNELEVANVYAVTNGTKSDDKDTNHGYLTVSKTLAAASETVTVTVTPDTGYQLETLSVAPTAGGDPITATQDTSDETKYTFTMPACEVTVTAEFEEIPTYCVMINAKNGSVDKNGMSGIPEGTAYSAEDNQLMILLSGGTETFTATPNEGYEFDCWKIGKTAAPANGTITANTTFTAVFKAVPYTVTVTDDGHGTAAASPMSGAINTVVTLTATPSAGYEFDRWEVISGGVTVANDQFTIGTANVEIKACFKESNLPTPTPAPTPAPYKVIEGANQTVMQDADSAKFRSDADYSKFLYVEVDGKKLNKHDYDSYSGSTVIVLKASFIKKLAVGVHTLKIVSSDGSATTKFTIKALPQTGDNTPVALSGLLLVGAICLAVLTIRKRKA